MGKNYFILFVFFTFLNVAYVTAQNDSIPITTDKSIVKDSLNFNQGTVKLIQIDTLTFIDSSRIYNPQRDSKRLLYNTGLFAGAALASFGLLWIAPESVSKWDKEEIKEEPSINSEVIED